MSFNPFRAIEEWQRKVGDRFDALPLRLRRVVALITAAALVGGMILVLVIASTDFVHAREAVRTQQHKTAVLVDIIPKGRSGTDYIIVVDGRDRVLDYADFLPDDTIGTTVRYVVDPDDPEHLIAVGSPDDWEDKPWRNILVSIGGIVGALLFAAMAADRIIPDDVEAVENRIPPAPWIKYLQRWPRHKKRRGGGTGRHSW